MTVVPGAGAAHTLGAWLAAREHVPPTALAARLRELLGRRALDADAREAPERLLDAGESVLARLLREAATTRESALDLLAADALVTYAFEAAADEPETLPARVSRAMASIARVPAAAAAVR